MSTVGAASAISFDDLREQVRGAVLTPEQDSFEANRSGWNLVVDHRPAVIVVPETTEDIQAAVRFASANDLSVAVQATGHAQMRYCEGGVLIRTERMTGVEIDADKGTARVQPGAQWQHVLNPAWEAGYSALCGSTPHVAVAGYTLGGGFSIMSRKYGMGVDKVLSLKLVTPSGELLNVSPTENPDLFWALRGGGGGFGVVAEIEIELCPNSSVYGGAVAYPAEIASDVYPAYIRWANELPDEVTTAINLLNLPPLPFIPEPIRGKAVILISICAVTEEEEGAKLAQPMRELGPILLEQFGQLPMPAAGAIWQDPVDPLPVQCRGIMLKALPENAMDAVLEAIGAPEQSPVLKYELRRLGGQMKRGSGRASAADYRRDAEYLLYAAGVTHPGNPPAQIIEGIEKAFAAIAPHTLCRGPINFLGEGDVSADHAREFYSEEALARLIGLKRALDPKNLFRYAGMGLFS